MHFCQFQPCVNHISGSISAGNFSVYSMIAMAATAWRTEKSHHGPQDKRQKSHNHVEPCHRTFLKIKYSK
jgi:hypothetical protein